MMEFIETWKSMGWTFGKTMYAFYAIFPFLFLFLVWIVEKSDVGGPSRRILKRFPFRF